MARLPEWLDDPPSGPNWHVIERVEFPRSTVFFIDVSDTPGDTRLVYKVKKTPQEDKHRPGGERFVNEAVRRLRAEGLMASPILAVEPHEATVVTLYTSGVGFEPIKWWDWRVSDVERRVYHDIGRACRIAESDLDLPADEVTESLRLKYEQLIGTANLDESMAADLRRWGSRRLQAIAHLPEPYVMSISDMTFSNVVVDGDVTGFIDLGLSPSLRGHAVSKMVHRIEYHHPLSPPVAGKAVAAVIEGYGSTRPLETEFLRVERLLRTLRGSATGLRAMISTRRRRALAELRALIREP
jgi:hypothetical protein